MAQMTVLALPMARLTAFDVGDAGLGLLHMEFETFTWYHRYYCWLSSFCN
jgi:hypothetical protein